jgi:hypothetical protein
MNNIIPHIPQGINFFYVFLLFLLGVYIFFIQRNSGLVYAIISEFFFPRPFVKIKNYSTSGIVISLLIVCNFSLFLYEVLHHKVVPFLPQIDLSLCFFTVVVCYFFTRAVLSWTSLLFGEEQFGNMVLQFTQVCGLFFLLLSTPVMLFIQCFWGNVAVLALKVLIVAGLLSWLVCVLRCIITGKAFTRFSVLHIFLYLCVSQILPFLILFKIITLYAAN